MQTFLPYSNFSESLRCLDNRRLNKQIVEALQIYNCLIKPNRWKNHPAVKMWKGNNYALVLYGNIAYNEWQRRWYTKKRNGKLEHKSGMEFRIILYQYPQKLMIEPMWLGNDKLHSSHRAALLYKDYKHYSKFNWLEEPQGPINGRWQYWWPGN
jgi:hypothetical protein